MKKIKKLLCIALAALMLCAAFAGCGKTIPSEQFFKYLEEMNTLKEATFNGTLSLNLTTSALSSFGDDGTLTSVFGDGGLDASFTMDGSTSYANKQAFVNTSAKLAINGADMSFDLTDVLIDGTDMYMNAGKIFALVSTFSGVDVSGILTSDYIMMDLAENGGADMWAEPAAGGELVLPEGLEDAESSLNDLFGRLEAKIKDSDPSYVSEADGVYTLTLDRAAIVELSTMILSDLRDNAEIYYDAFKSIYEANPDMAGADEALSIFGDRGEDVASLKEALDEMLGSMDSIPEMTVTASISFDAKAKSYAVSMSVSVPDTLTVGFNWSIASAAVAKRDVPADALTLDEFNEFINSFSAGSGALPDDGQDAAAPALDLNIVTGTANPSIIDADLTGALQLTPVSMTSGEAEYILPCIVDDGMTAEDGSLYASSAESAFYYTYYELGGSTTADLLTQNAEYSNSIFAAYGDAYSDIAFSDLWTSADGSFSLLSCGYTLTGAGRQYELTGAEETGDGGAIFFSVSFLDPNGGELAASVAEFAALIGVDIANFIV